MATRKTKEAQQAEPTLGDVLGAVKDVGGRVTALTNKVDSVERRVTALEKAPAMKPRVVQQQPAPTNGRQAPEVVYAQPQAQDEGEDEAIQAGNWEKVIRTSRCYKLGVTKTRIRDSWKLKLYMRGQRRPATVIGWDGTANLIEFMREVWPEISEDHFDEETFKEADEGKDIPVEFQFDNVHFLVDWFRTAPNYRGHTFINVEGVYPLSSDG